MKYGNVFLKIFTFFILCLGHSGCLYEFKSRESSSQSTHRTFSSLSNEKNNSSVQNSLSTRAISILESKCLICHNGAGAPTSWGVPSGSNDQVWIHSTPTGLILPGDPSNSRLVKFMKFSNNGSMPPASVKFEQAEYDTIIQWIFSLKSSPSGGNGGSKETDLGESGESIYIPLDKIRFGDRNYVAFIFEEVFGPQEESKKIRRQVLAFGGPCPIKTGWNNGYSGPECIHLNEAIYYATPSMSFATKGDVQMALSDKHLDKVDMATADAKIVPDSDIVREGYRTLACEKLLFNFDYGTVAATPLLQAITRIHLFSKAAAGESPQSLDFNTYPVADSIPSDDEIIATFKMFYNFRAPTTQQLSALKKVAERANQNDIQAIGKWPKRFEPWRYLLYTVCMSPDWQIP